MSNIWSRGAVAALIVLLSSMGQAAVLRVPGDYAAIQAAIVASVNGDVILVSPGLYSEAINFRGKAITLSSTDPNDPNVVSNTVIRAVGLRSVVSFITGETSRSVLTGFTITGGFGTPNAALGDGAYAGGGIYCYRASPTIVANVITGNSPPNNPAIFRYGCGIGCIESDAIIARNLITANRGYAGGGIMTYLSNARIANNVISSNSVVFGGGLLLLNGGQVSQNTLVGNDAQFAGNVYVTSDTPGQWLLTGNIICHATAGGGVYVDGPADPTQMTYNDVWNNTGGDYTGGDIRTGLNGNISQDPQFEAPENGDYRLRDVSACINAGDPAFQPAAGESDFYGGARVYAGRVDIGANEYFDNFRPLAQAGPDQVAGVTQLPALITLDGSASSDPNGAALSYHWTQISGPPGSFVDAGAAKPGFNVVELGTYTFELVVNNGSFNSFADTVRVTAKNEVPTANAGPDQNHSELQPIPSIALEGSRSFDPENAVLSYRWKQIGGWKIQLNDPNAANPMFLHPWPGAYVFELVVNDGIQDSKPDVVAVVIGPNHAPVADAGLPRYAAAGSVTLDGTGSYDPDGYGTLTFQWKQISGPTVTMTGADAATPLLSGFVPGGTNRTCVFELVVSDGYLVSPPSSVRVIIVRNFGTNTIRLINPPFDPAKPTIVAFGGGNCSTGSGMTFGGAWSERANWLTVSSYGPAYIRYADMLIVYLSSVAPDYRQPIQTIGYSTGNLVAMDLAWYINATFRDPRYAVNRVSLLDPVCSFLSFRSGPFQTNRIAGEQAWVDNYISYDPAFNVQPILPGAFNVVCRPPRSHSYPVQRYSSSSFEYENGGMTAFGYLSVIGRGKNYQLDVASRKYYFAIDDAESVAFFNQSLYPGKILAPVQLTGPADGATLDPNGAALGCEPVENAVGYQFLLGSDPDRVMDYTMLSDTPNPPSQTLSTLPQEHAWWTVRAYDQFGSTIYADPRQIKLPENRPPVAETGPDQVLYAGFDGVAQTTLNGSASTDPDGDALGFTWVWAVGAHPFQTNAVSVTIELPIGVHTAQLMVHDGQVSSQPAQLKISVVSPFQCPLKIVPSEINLRKRRPQILASIRLPRGFTRAEAQTDEPLLLYPGGLQAVRQWTVGGNANQISLVGFFDKEELPDSLRDGPAVLTVVGTLRSGQVIYGRATVQILGTSRTGANPPPPGLLLPSGTPPMKSDALSAPSRGIQTGWRFAK